MDLEQAVQEFGSSIVKYCYSLLLDYHEAQDAAQSVFLTITEKPDSLRDNEKLAAWLYRIAHNICIDMLRRRRRAKLFLSQETVVSTESYVDHYNFGISGALKTALNTLSPKDRALVYNRAVDEMDYLSMEEIYGVKANTLRKRYERVRKKLEKELRKEESYCE